MLASDKDDVKKSGEDWTDRRAPDRPRFIEGWRKAIRRKVADARKAPPVSPAPTAHIEVWIANPDHLMPAQSALALLSDDDWALINRNQDPVRKRAAITARVVLRIALSHASGHTVKAGEWRFVVTPLGKPAVAPDLPQVHFSVSHLDNLVAVAVSAEREIGIDIECIDQNVRPGGKRNEATTTRIAAAVLRRDRATASLAEEGPVTAAPALPRDTTAFGCASIFGSCAFSRPA